MTRSACLRSSSCGGGAPFRSKFSIQFIDGLGLFLRGAYPVPHRRQFHDAVTIGAADRVELDVVGAKARHHRRVHGVRHRLLAEQEGAAISSEALTPEADNAVDVGLCP